MSARPQPITESPASLPARAPLRVVRGRSAWWSPLPLVLYTTLAVGAFLALIYLRTAVDEVVYDITIISNQIDQELERRERLADEVRALQSPWNVVPVAEEMLGMVLPAEVTPLRASRVVSDDPLQSPRSSG